MIRNYVVLCLALVSTSIFANGHTLLEQDVQKILSDPNRPQADANRDINRKPEKIIPFIEIEEGDNVIDLLAGGGWYTELFSKAVGETGKVYMHNDEVSWAFTQKAAIARTSNQRLSNVTRLDDLAIVDIKAPAKSVDVMFTALNYHDLFFFERKDREGNIIKLRKGGVVDYKAAFSHLKTLLKDDGVLVIIDHVAPAGSGYEAPSKLHRIDPNIVKYQMDQVGFKLVEEAFYLSNDDDDLTKNVFIPGTRGKTDRFIYKFVKQQ